MPSIDQLRELLAKEPDDAFLNFGLAMALRKEGRDAEALEQFDRTLQVDANYVAAYFHKGQLLAALGDSSAARSVLEQGIARAIEVGDEHARGEMAEFVETLD